MSLKQQESVETGSDWVLPIAGLAFAAYYLYSIRDLAWEAKISAVCVAVILVILSTVFLIRSVIGLMRDERHIGFRRLYDNWTVMRLRIGLFALAIGYIFVIPYAGFTLTTFIFLCAALKLIGRLSWRPTLMWSTLLSLAGWALFIAALGTRFPRGPFETATFALFGV